MENEIRIKKGLKIGELDAESDQKYLDDTFIDNGTIASLINVEEHASIIVGRTGAGKSALIYKISRSVDNPIQIDPTNISIRFLENSSIIQFLNELGIKLDLFYKLLWRHILVLELIKYRYNIKNKNENKNFLMRISGWAGRNSEKREMAISYFREWSEKFWQDTEEHIKEITDKFTSDIKSEFKANNFPVDLSIEGAKNLSVETKSEIKSLATSAVNKIQIQKLNEILDTL